MIDLLLVAVTVAFFVGLTALGRGLDRLSADPSSGDPNGGRR